MISQSAVGSGGASTRISSYFAAQFGHSNLNCALEFIADRGR
jgi:hypothetical protein